MIWIKSTRKVWMVALMPLLQSRKTLNQFRSKSQKYSSPPLRSRCLTNKRLNRLDLKLVSPSRSPCILCHKLGSWTICWSLQMTTSPCLVRQRHYLKSRGRTFSAWVQPTNQTQVVVPWSKPRPCQAFWPLKIVIRQHQINSSSRWASSLAIDLRGNRSRTSDSITPQMMMR